MEQFLQNLSIAKDNPSGRTQSSPIAFNDINMRDIRQFLRVVLSRNLDFSQNLSGIFGRNFQDSYKTTSCIYRPSLKKIVGAKVPE